MVSCLRPSRDFIFHYFHAIVLHCTVLYAFMLYNLKLPFFGRDANCVKCSKYGASTLSVM